MNERRKQKQILSLVLTLFAFSTSASFAQTDVWHSMNPLWIDAQNAAPDTFAAFRGSFELPAPTEIEIRFLGATWFNLWLDGEFVGDGPARFPLDNPEYDAIRKSLPAGTHVLASQVHYEGIQTRILDDVNPFWACEIRANGEPLPIRWRCSSLAGYASRVRRINPQLGWIEWCDTNAIPENWRDVSFGDSQWPVPVSVDPNIGEPKPLSIASVRSFTHSLKPVAEGPLAETFGYERDDIPARFFLRDLVCGELPARGVWRRYDLGRVRLARPRFVLDVPKGTVVEFAYSESLVRGRVSPYITLSAGASCNLDRFIARGGEREFFPLAPRGGRFAEIHVFADPSKVRFVREEFIERCYYDSPQGSFECGDELLERVWMTGIETLRGCCEDAVIDNPTRERGEWTGDVSTVAMDIASAGYSDLRLCRRALVHSALCAREDGLVAGLCPGGEAYLSSYSAQWVSGCMHYWRLTGDRALLVELFDCAERNMQAFERCFSDSGLTDALGWGFIDWGYVRNPGPSDMALNLHCLAALRDMIHWCEVVKKPERAAYYQTLEAKMTDIVEKWFTNQLNGGTDGWNAVGYHRAVLGLRLNFFSGERERECVDYIKRHILSCFPNNPSAPRNGDPTKNDPQLITPYFAHYAFPLLIERGEMDFVLDRYRTCWGWALGGGRTTWVEVFDTRWTHCHQWAGCPTGQLSRYVLGLHTRYDLGDRRFVLNLKPGSLSRAEGKLPIPNSESNECIHVRWIKKTDGVHYTLKTPSPIYLHVKSTDPNQPERIIPIKDSFKFVIFQSLLNDSPSPPGRVSG